MAMSSYTAVRCPRWLRQLTHLLIEGQGESPVPHCPSSSSQLQLPTSIQTHDHGITFLSPLQYTAVVMVNAFVIIHTPPLQTIRKLRSCVGTREPQVQAGSIQPNNDRGEARGSRQSSRTGQRRRRPAIPPLHFKNIVK